MPRRAPVYQPLTPRPCDLSPEERAKGGVLSVDEAAAFIRVKRRKMEYMLAAREIPSVKVGRSRVVFRAACEAYLANLDREQNG